MDRIEVITEVQRRRRYTAEERAVMVAECLKPGMSVSEPAFLVELSASIPGILGHPERTGLMNCQYPWDTGRKT